MSTKAAAMVISKVNPKVNPVGVEAHMREKYGTLGSLSFAKFRRETAAARLKETNEPGYLRRMAAAHNDLVAFDEWEATNAE